MFAISENTGNLGGDNEEAFGPSWTENTISEI